MSTRLQPLNGLDEALPTASDYIPWFDSAGSTHKAQFGNMEFTPPQFWQDLIFDDVRIAYRNGAYLRTAPLNRYSQFRNAFLGLALPKFGKLVYPEVVKRPWGTSSMSCVTTDENTSFYTILSSGAEQTLTAYNASPENQGNDCAVGYAHNFERMTTEGGTMMGIKRGSWYLPHPSECMQIILPNYAKLKYAASLLGFNWDTSTFWTSSDKMSNTQNAYRFSLDVAGNTLGTTKSSNFGVLLLANMTLGVYSPTT